MATFLKLLILSSIQVLIVFGVSKKKGIVHMVEDWICGDDNTLDNMAWWYDYSPNREYFDSRSNCSPFKNNKQYNDLFVPMAWGLSSKLVGNDNGKFCLGYNEPNHIKQSNMTAEQAAEAWPELERKCKGAKLVSPSACVCGELCIDTPTNWFDTFFMLCKDCRVDYIATHTFSCNANKVMKYLEDLYDRYGKQIWLTEFTCAEQDDPEIIKIYMKAILPRLEAAEYIFRDGYVMGGFYESFVGVEKIPDKRNSPNVKNKELFVQRRPKDGDDVLIKDILPKAKWKIGKVEEVIESDDNIVRSGIVQTSHETIANISIHMFFPTEF